LDAPLGVVDFEDIAVSLYPNPAAPGQLIQWATLVDFTQIRITDIAGKTVFQEDLTGQNSIMPNLSGGVYFVSLQNASVAKTSKIVVE
jgi:hypothetical protein